MIIEVDVGAKGIYKMKDISIITPFYHGNQYLPSLLKNIENAAKNISDREVEWVVVNDSPTENIIPLTSKVKNLKITFYKNSSNVGIQKARINGLKKAEGKYIMFLDQDDEISDDALKIHLSTIENADVSITNGIEKNINGKKELLFKSLTEMKILNDINYYFYLGNFIISPGMTLIKRKSIPKEWIEKSLRINGADDWLLWIIMLEQKAKFNLSLKTTYVHNRNENSVSNSEKKMIDSTNEALEYFIECFPREKKLYKVGKKRLDFRKQLAVNKKNKYLLYIQHPHIAMYSLSKKIRQKGRS